MVQLSLRQTLPAESSYFEKLGQKHYMGEDAKWKWALQLARSCEGNIPQATIRATEMQTPF